MWLLEEKKNASSQRSQPAPGQWQSSENIFVTKQLNIRRDEKSDRKKLSKKINKFAKINNVIVAEIWDLQAQYLKISPGGRLDIMCAWIESH